MIHQAFPHETLHAYTLAVECARWFRRARWPRGYAGLRDQGIRAAESLVRPPEPRPDPVDRKHPLPNLRLFQPLQGLTGGPGTVSRPARRTPP